MALQNHFLAGMTNLFVSWYQK